MSLKVVCLQQHPELMDQCIDLLNSQWPRSKTARLRSLEQGSKESFPTSLVLIEVKENTKDVVGHCKISPVPYKRDICFVESVVISSNRRGKGLGRHIMEQTEIYVKSKGIKTIYLTTYDQQIFYEHLGYIFCDPIQLYGGGSPALLKFIENQNEPPEYDCTMDNPVTLKNVTISGGSKPESPKCTSENNKCAPPPPPPPPPSNIALTNKMPVIINGVSSTQNLKFTMKKTLV